mmetsp:Transcript_22983/g.56819  ORF Transcript_22983/g.56819 Transcript_22983/m.56819 type:complete len:267 (-) Transcript_22983:765-1565(-)
MQRTRELRQDAEQVPEGSDVQGAQQAEGLAAGVPSAAAIGSRGRRPGRHRQQQRPQGDPPVCLPDERHEARAVDGHLVPRLLQTSPRVSVQVLDAQGPQGPVLLRRQFVPCRPQDGRTRCQNASTRNPLRRRWVCGTAGHAVQGSRGALPVHFPAAGRRVPGAPLHPRRSTPLTQVPRGHPHTLRRWTRPQTGRQTDRRERGRVVSGSAGQRRGVYELRGVVEVPRRRGHLRPRGQREDRRDRRTMGLQLTGAHLPGACKRPRPCV